MYHIANSVNSFSSPPNSAGEGSSLVLTITRPKSPTYVCHSMVGIQKVTGEVFCPKARPGIFGINGQRAGSCQICWTGLVSQKSRTHKICPKIPFWIFRLNGQRAGSCQICWTELASRESSGRHLPEKPVQDFQDKQSCGRDFANPGQHGID